MDAKELGESTVSPQPYVTGSRGEYHTEYTSGITLRQHFAGLAMQGSLGGAPGSHLTPYTLARESVAHADALLAELAKDQP